MFCVFRSRGFFHFSRKLNHLSAPFRRNPFHLLLETTRNVELNHLCHSILRSIATVSDFAVVTVPSCRPVTSLDAFFRHLGRGSKIHARPPAVLMEKVESRQNTP